MSSYCKAYDLMLLSQFPGWKIKTDILLKSIGSTATENNASDTGNSRCYLFLHDDFRVTNGIYPNEGIAFDDITPEWIEFCKAILKFAPSEVTSQ